MMQPGTSGPSRQESEPLDALTTGSMLDVPRLVNRDGLTGCLFFKIHEAHNSTLRALSMKLFR